MAINLIFFNLASFSGSTGVFIVPAIMFSCFLQIFSPVVAFTKTSTKVFLGTIQDTTRFTRSFSVILVAMLNVISNYKILNPIIVLNTVKMMYDFIRGKITTNMFFHYQSMFKNITITFSKRMFRLINKSVASAVNNNSTTPSTATFTSWYMFEPTTTAHVAARFSFQISRSSIINKFATVITLFSNHSSNYSMGGV
jgi:hypothetical protein